MQRQARAVTVKGQWHALVARLLTVSVLLAALFLPPCIEGDSLANAATAIATVAAASDSQAGDALPLGGLVHAGAHCSCQLGDRVKWQETPRPMSAGSVEHQPGSTCGHPSRVTEPLSRPPQI